MTAVEFAILTPLVFILLMTTVQFAIYLYAKEAAQSAVRDGETKAREEAGSRGCMGTDAKWLAEAEQAVSDRATANSGTLLTIAPGGVTATAVPDFTVQGGCQATVTVTLDAGVPQFLPWSPSMVHVKASGPVEQFVRHP
jgi:Flp pilus assembly protein TadG